MLGLLLVEQKAPVIVFFNVCYDYAVVIVVHSLRIRLENVDDVWSSMQGRGKVFMEIFQDGWRSGQAEESSGG